MDPREISRRGEELTFSIVTAGIAGVVEGDPALEATVADLIDSDLAMCASDQERCHLVGAVARRSAELLGAFIIEIGRITGEDPRVIWSNTVRAAREGRAPGVRPSAG